MRMRWVITRKKDDSLPARLVIQGFTDPQLGANLPLRSQSPGAVSDGSRVFKTWRKARSETQQWVPNQ